MHYISTVVLQILVFNQPKLWRKKNIFVVLIQIIFNFFNHARIDWKLHLKLFSVDLASNFIEILFFFKEYAPSRYGAEFKPF